MQINILSEELSYWIIKILTLSNAVLVGAKTVKGPGPARVSTKPAALTAVRRVENLGLVDTNSAMDFGLFLTTTGATTLGWWTTPGVCTDSGWMLKELWTGWTLCTVWTGLWTWWADPRFTVVKGAWWTPCVAWWAAPWWSAWCAPWCAPWWAPWSPWWWCPPGPSGLAVTVAPRTITTVRYFMMSVCFLTVMWSASHTLYTHLAGRTESKKGSQVTLQLRVALLHIFQARLFRLINIINSVNLIIKCNFHLSTPSLLAPPVMKTLPVYPAPCFLVLVVACGAMVKTVPAQGWSWQITRLKLIGRYMGIGCHCLGYAGWTMENIDLWETIGCKDILL